jgi:hypothetical protein
MTRTLTLGVWTLDDERVLDWTESETLDLQLALQVALVLAVRTLPRHGYDVLSLTSLWLWLQVIVESTHWDRDTLLC